MKKEESNWTPQKCDARIYRERLIYLQDMHIRLNESKKEIKKEMDAIRAYLRSIGGG